MNRLISVLTLLSALNAYALGPIPNGTYTGSENCTDYPPIATTLVATDSTLKWDDQTLAFDIDQNGFFKLHSLDGWNGTGLGHFTQDGLHYEVIFDMPMASGKTAPAPGEITFSYDQGTLRLNSSASKVAGGTIYCSGSFSKTP